MALAFVGGIAIGAASWHDRGESREYGAFTEQRTTCDAAWVRRGGCESTGLWVSDDGGTTLHDVALDGDVDRGATVRAWRRTGGAMGDDDIVHRPTRTHPELWLPWALAMFAAGSASGARRRWRREDARRSESVLQAEAGRDLP